MSGAADNTCLAAPHVGQTLTGRPQATKIHQFRRSSAITVITCLALLLPIDLLCPVLRFHVLFSLVNERESEAVIDILDKWQRGEFHGRLEASFPDDRPRSIVSRESRFFGERLRRPPKRLRMIRRTAAAAEPEVSEKRKECGEKEREIEQHARISRSRVLHAPNLEVNP